MTVVDCKHCVGKGYSPYASSPLFECPHCSGTGLVTEPCPILDKDPVAHKQDGCTVCANSGKVSKRVYWVFAHGARKRFRKEKREELLEEWNNHGSC